MPPGLHAWEYDMAGALAGVQADAWARGLVLGRVAAAVMVDISQAWPVDTGLSLAGFRREPRGTTWFVFNDVEYTPYVHNGLADKLAQASVEAHRPFARAELARVMATRQQPGARGDFRLKRSKSGLARIEVTKAARATREAVAAVETASSALSGAETQAVARMIRGGDFRGAIRRLRYLGQAETARRVAKAAKKVG